MKLFQVYLDERSVFFGGAIHIFYQSYRIVITCNVKTFLDRDRNTVKRSSIFFFYIFLEPNRTISTFFTQKIGYAVGII